MRQAAAWLIAAAPLLWTCSGAPAPAPLARDLQSIEDQLRQEFAAQRKPFPRNAGEVIDLQQQSLLVFVSEQRRLPVSAMMDDAARQELRKYVATGGRLLLLGFAARLVHEIGIEPQAPDRFAIYRFGDSPDTNRGEYRYGLCFQEPAPLPLIEGLRPVDSASDSFMIGGGVMARSQCCFWEQHKARDGIVMARLARLRDGDFARLGASMLTAWNHSGGRVLAIGSLPEPWRDDPVTRGNANQLLRNAILSMCGGRPASVTLCVDAAIKPANVERMPPLAQRRFPGLAQVAHWGWQVPVQFQRDGLAPLEPELLRKNVLLASARAGATCLSLQITDTDAGYPLIWDERDALPRPPTFWGGGYQTPWTLAALRSLASSAHQLGVSPRIMLDPDPTRGGGPAGMLASARFFGRQLMDRRRLGPAAFDGVSVRSWFEDPAGDTAAALREWHPAFVGLSTGHLLAGFPGFVATRDAEFGRPKGLQGAGISDAWRDTFDAWEYPVAILDCRGRQPLRRLWREAAIGGGSYGDWILTQANDFARPRLGPAAAGIGAGMLWRFHNEATLAPRAVDYVHGVSMAPLRAAVAGRLLATGRGGFRDLQRQFDPALQSGFAAESEYPAHSVFLQNNHFRLHGTGGALLLDASGLARFRNGDPTRRMLAHKFLQSSWRGLRPTVAEMDAVQVNFMVGAPRGEGGYGTRHVLDQTELGAGRFPAMLAHDEPGRWPREIQLTWASGQGQYELLLLLRGVDGRGIVELRRDGDVVRLLAFQAGEATQELRLPLPVARPPHAVDGRAGRRHSLSLHVVQGGRVALLGCRLARQGSLAVATAVPHQESIAEAAGHVATLREDTWAPMLEEHKTITTIADLPAFVLTIHYGHVEGGLQVLRQFGFELHRLLRGVSAEDAKALRQPFVLSSSDPNTPDLVVAPLHLPDRHHFRFDPSAGLQLLGVPRANETVKLGFWFMRDPPANRLETIRKVLEDLCDPPRLQIDDDGAATVMPLVDAAFPHPRLVRVVNASKESYVVREGGAWTYRSGQAVQEGLGEWVLIHHLDGQPVAVHTGARLAQHAQPTPGARHSLAISDETERGLTVHVVQCGPMLPAPGVVLPRPFQQVLVDDKPWRYLDGRTVYLPRRLGAHSLKIDPGRDGPIEASADSVGLPALALTDADVRQCSYDRENKVLSVFTRPRAGHDGTHVGWFSGGLPSSIDGGEVINDAALRYHRDEERSAAARAGVLVRFQPGLLRLHYR